MFANDLVDITDYGYVCGTNLYSVVFFYPFFVALPKHRNPANTLFSSVVSEILGRGENTSHSLLKAVWELITYGDAFFFCYILVEGLLHMGFLFFWAYFLIFWHLEDPASLWWKVFVFRFLFLVKLSLKWAGIFLWKGITYGSILIYVSRYHYGSLIRKNT